MNNTIKNNITLSLLLLMAPNVLMGMEFFFKQGPTKRNSLAPFLVQGAMTLGSVLCNEFGKKDLNLSNNPLCSIDHKSVQIQGMNKPGKKTMEDRMQIEVDFVPPHMDFFSVYDGHGGSTIAAHARQNFHMVLAKKIKKGVPIEKALEETFLAIDEDIRQQYIKNIPEWSAGSTASVVVVDKKTSHAYVAHAGDSRVCIYRSGERILGTKDHHPGDQQEREAIVNRGSFIFSGRIGGSLAVSRALGDFVYGYPGMQGKQAYTEKVISANPDITVCGLEKDDVIVLATDGLWNEVNNKKVLAIIDKDKTADNIIQMLVEKTPFYENANGERAPQDDVSIIVIRVK